MALKSISLQIEVELVLRVINQKSFEAKEEKVSRGGGPLIKNVAGDTEMITL